jgi:hypothetical protein
MNKFLENTFWFVVMCTSLYYSLIVLTDQIISGRI